MFSHLWLLSLPVSGRLEDAFPSLYRVLLSSKLAAAGAVRGIGSGSLLAALFCSKITLTYFQTAVSNIEHKCAINVVQAGARFA